jgi:hypothetical protein
MDDPEIPTDELVKRYLDVRFSLDTLVKGDEIKISNDN